LPSFSTFILKKQNKATALAPLSIWPVAPTLCARSKALWAYSRGGGLEGARAI